MRHWLRTAGEGVVITLVAFFIIFYCHVLMEPYLLSVDTRSRISENTAEAASAREYLHACVQDARVAAAYTRGLEGSELNKQQMINSQQLQIAKQLQTMNVCVVDIVKQHGMEPLLISSTSFGIDREFQPKGSPRIRVLIALTNIPTSTFIGRISCKGPFTLLQFLMLEGPVGYGGKAYVAKGHQPGHPVVLDFSGTAWSPGQPLVAMVQAAADKDDEGQTNTLDCDIRQQ